MRTRHNSGARGASSVGQLTARAMFITLIGVGLTAATVFLLVRSTSPSVALAFAGYDKNGWVQFTLTNHTRFHLLHSHPRIQVYTSAGWTNYFGIESLMCRLSGPLPAHDGTILSASLPGDCQRWKATMRYQVIPVYEPGWRTALDSMLAAVRLGPRTNEITLMTPEFVR